MKKFYVALLALVVGILSFSAAAFAGTALHSLATDVAQTSPDTGLIDLAKPVFDAIMHSNWWMVASLGLVLACAALKKLAPEGGRIQAFIHTDLGGALLVLATSFGGAIATGLAAAGTGAMTWALLATAGKVAFGAAGGYSLFKKLALPLLTKIAESSKTPSWLKSILSLVMWAFQPSPAIAKAETEGNDAVAAKPAEGAAAPSAAGTPTEIK